MQNLFVDINSKKIRYEDAEKNQMEFELKLSSVRVVGNKSDKQLSEIENTTKIDNSRKEDIKFYKDYSKMVRKAAYRVKHGKGLKILTPT